MKTVSRWGGGVKYYLKNVTNSGPSVEKKNELRILMEKLELDLALNNLNASGQKKCRLVLNPWCRSDPFLDRSSILSQLKGLIISGKANSVVSQKVTFASGLFQIGRAHV